MQFDVWKFNQYFNILPGKEKDYRKFLEEEFIPGMEKCGDDRLSDQYMEGSNRLRTLCSCGRHRL